MPARPVGVVLAGGESRRMPGGSKALARLNGKPLLQHALDRLVGQVGQILLSVHAHDVALADFGHEQVVDVVQRQRGPLTGLYSSMLYAREAALGPWLLLAPCDAPFLPLDLGPRLLGAALAGGQRLSMAYSAGEPQPVFSLWHLETLPVLQSELLERGRGGLRRLLSDIPHARVDWSEQVPDPFMNINTPADLAVAEVDGCLREGRH